MQQSSSKARIEYIDLAKGICILLVVLDHISNEGYFSAGNYPLNEVFDQMRMPLYFILSGLFFKDYAGGFREFLLRKVNRILIPYLFFITLYRIVPWLIQRFTSLSTIYEDTSDAWGPLWFLRCLFFMNVIFALAYYLIRRVFPSNTLTQDLLLGSCMLGIGIAGYYSGNLHVNFGTAMTCMPLFWSGYFLNRKLHLLQRRIPWWLALSSAIVLFAVLHYLYVGENFFYCNDYNSPLPLLYFSGFFGTFAVLMLSRVIKWLPIISYIGRYSIIVLCTHMGVMMGVIAALNLLPGDWDEVGTLQSLTVLALTIAICMFLCWLLSKYLPWFTAQKDLIRVTGKQDTHAG